MTNAITVRGANKHYGDFAALDNVDFDVPSGSLTALLGPSGSGKSTLLRAIAGLDQPDTGTITINGSDVTGVPPQRRGIGFVFQHYAAFKHLTVRDNVAFGLKIRKRPKSEVKEKVDNLLEVVGLSGFQTRYPNQLSGGQRQRMALARALAVDPQVLLLDEPFGALDAKVREDLRAWLRRLHDEVHVTTVLVTHDQAEALDVADRIAVLNKGRIEQVGSPTEVYDSPANAFVMSFLGAVSSFNGILVRPHDIRVGRNPDMAIADSDDSVQATGVLRATINRIVMLGFEVRVELTSAANRRRSPRRLPAAMPRRSGSTRVTPSMSGRPACRRCPAAPSVPEVDSADEDEALTQGLRSSLGSEVAVGRRPDAVDGVVARRICLVRQRAVAGHRSRVAPVPVQVQRACGGRRPAGVEESLRRRDRQPLGDQLRLGDGDGDLGDARRGRCCRPWSTSRSIASAAASTMASADAAAAEISPTACNTNGSVSAVSATECEAGRAFVRT